MIQVKTWCDALIKRNHIRHFIFDEASGIPGRMNDCHRKWAKMITFSWYLPLKMVWVKTKTAGAGKIMCLLYNFHYPSPNWSFSINNVIALTTRNRQKLNELIQIDFNVFFIVLFNQLCFYRRRQQLRWQRRL